MSYCTVAAPRRLARLVLVGLLALAGCSRRGDAPPAPGPPAAPCRAADAAVAGPGGEDVLAAIVAETPLVEPVSPLPAALLEDVRLETEDDLRDWLDLLDAEVEALHTARQLEFYLRLVGRPAPNVARYQELHRRLFADRAAAARLEAWRERAEDPATKRRVELYLGRYLDFLYDTFRLARTAPETRTRFTALQDELDAALVAFRPLVGGERTTRARVSILLRTEPDRARRREAFLSRAEAAAQLAGRMRELLEVSNALHREMGYAGTVEGRLEQSGLRRDEVEAWLDEVERATRAPYAELLERARTDLGVERVEAWDLDYWLEQAGGYPAQAFPKADAVARLKDTLRGWGLEPDALPVTVEEANLANAGWNIPIRIPADVRLVLNPTDGFPFYATLFHEYGHALHESGIDQAVGTFRSDRPGQFGEGMAATVERLPGMRAWQRRTAGLDDATMARAEQVERWRKLRRLRSLIARVRFHYAAFDDPAGDLDGLDGRLTAELLGVAAPEQPLWADDMFLVQPQIYVQNYVLAELIAAQVWETLRARFAPDPTADPRVGPFLRDAFWRHGQARDWRELIAEATGRPLDPAALVAELTAGGAAPDRSP
jgi:hypothetical protein